ncbi:hypothetical protein C0989_000611 [Termitomyces sp. Mn162]|nr:hypothetical protein C0989_000611 [Termitomyces sp. Mn162]
MTSMDVCYPSLMEQEELFVELLVVQDVASAPSPNSPVPAPPAEGSLVSEAGLVESEEDF